MPRRLRRKLREVHKAPTAAVSLVTRRDGQQSEEENTHIASSLAPTSAYSKGPIKRTGVRDNGAR